MKKSSWMINDTFMDGTEFANHFDEEPDKDFKVSTESELVEQARAGNQDVFGELVRKHRAAALGVANHLVRDAHMAEDVQNALIRAFMHVGTLVDTNKFVPWLHRIVRNQALLRLRRGRPVCKGATFFRLGDKRGFETCTVKQSC